jgi:hypothetical protein
MRCDRWDLAAATVTTYLRPHRIYHTHSCHEIFRICVDWCTQRGVVIGSVTVIIVMHRIHISVVASIVMNCQIEHVFMYTQTHITSHTFVRPAYLTSRNSSVRCTARAQCQRTKHTKTPHLWPTASNGAWPHYAINSSTQHQNTDHQLCSQGTRTAARRATTRRRGSRAADLRSSVQQSLDYTKNSPAGEHTPRVTSSRVCHWRRVAHVNKPSTTHRLSHQSVDRLDVGACTDQPKSLQASA